MAMDPVYKPVGETTAKVNGMAVGKAIFVYGRARVDADKFRIDLINGKENFIALHFNVRFAEKQVVRNTRSNEWGTEERSGGFPFKKGGLFAVKFKCTDDDFEISVDGNHFTTYRHRLDFTSITEVSVGQQCDVILLTSEMEGQELSVGAAISNPTHGSYDIPDRRKVQIIGTPTNESGRFKLNFRTEADDISLHYNPRLNEKKIVRNTNLNGAWGAEERNLNIDFPFKSGVPFITTITFSNEIYEVEINGLMAFAYVNRIPYQRVCILEISEDVQLHKIIVY